MTEETKTTDVTKTEAGGLPTLSPEQIALMAKTAGKQKFSIRELMVPVLKIANTTTSVMKRSSSDYIEGIKEGQFVDTLSRIPVDPPIDLIIVRFETNYIESKPNMGPTVKLWGTDPTGYQQAVGGDVGVRSTKDGNEIRELGAYYALWLRPDSTTLPCIYYMGSTAWKEARRLNALLASYEIMGPDGPFIAPPYSRIYKATTVPDGNDKNTWMAWKFAMGPLTLSLPDKRGMHLWQRAADLEEAIDKRLTRIHGTADDERFAEAQENRARQDRSGASSGPPADNAPPPASEADYGGGPRQGETIVDKAKTAPF